MATIGYKPGQVVLTPAGNTAFGAKLALVTKATKGAVTVITGDGFELVYDPADLTHVGNFSFGAAYTRGKRRFRRCCYFDSGPGSWRFDLIVREPGEGEVTAVADLRRMAFARLMEAQEQKP